MARVISQVENKDRNEVVELGNTVAMCFTRARSFTRASAGSSRVHRDEDGLPALFEHRRDDIPELVESLERERLEVLGLRLDRAHGEAATGARPLRPLLGVHQGEVSHDFDALDANRVECPLRKRPADAECIEVDPNTVAPDTVAKVGSNWLNWSCLSFCTGSCATLHLVHRRDVTGSPENVLLSDVPTIVNLLLYTVAVLAVLYLGPR
jgi:hypothetical protein